MESPDDDDLPSAPPHPSPSESTSDLTPPPTAWQRICDQLRRKIGADNFQRWFADATVEERSDLFSICVATPISQLWIESNYGAIVADSVADVLGTAVQVELVSNDKPPALSEAHLSVQGGELKVARLHQTKPERPRESGSGRFVKEDAPAPIRSLADAGLNAKFSFDSFVVGSNSSYSTAVARAVAEKPGRIYNPLFFHGASGLGKTHLMQAIGQEILMRKKRAVVRYVTSEQFTNEFVEAIRKNAFTAFRQKYRKVDVLMIDDIHFLAGKDSTQEEFFHTFNELFNGARQIILASDRPPSEIKNLEARLVSRCEWGLTTQIQMPDYETRMAILRRKQADYHVSIEPWILELMAQRIKGNVRKLEGALMRVAAHLSLEGEIASESSLVTLLNDILDQEPTRSVTVDRIQRVVATQFDLRISDLTGPRRTKTIAEARQIAMYLVRTLIKMPLIQIGEEFGNRDHGTVIHACRQVDKKTAADHALRQLVDSLSGKVLAD